MPTAYTDEFFDSASEDPYRSILRVCEDVLYDNQELDAYDFENYEELL